MRSVLKPSGLAFILLLCSSNAWAQSSEDVERAQQHFAKGAEWFAGGEYAKAVSEFMSGHALAPNAMFLYNVSLSYERLGRLEDARGAAQKARQFPGMPDEVAIRNEARIQGFTVALMSMKVSEATAAVASNEGTTTEGVTTSETMTRPDGITTLGWVGLGLVAAGGGFIVGGVATNSAIVKEIEVYEAAAQSGDIAAYDDSRDAIEKKQSLGKILYGVGAGAAGLGAALFIVDLLTGTEEVPVAVLVPLSDGAMISATLRF